MTCNATECRAPRKGTDRVGACPEDGFRKGRTPLANLPRNPAAQR